MGVDALKQHKVLGWDAKAHTATSSDVDLNVLTVAAGLALLTFVLCMITALILTDIIWIGFNIIMIKKSVEVIQDLTEFPYMSPALEWSMAYVYWIFPISFALMSIRVIQVDIMKYILKINVKDVDTIDLEETKKIIAEVEPK